MPLVDAIAETFGKNCEVVLHDFMKPHQSIIKIANGHLTGRNIGGPATDLILSYLGKKETKTDSLIGYSTRTKKGNELKSTTIFIKNNKQKIVGALCINIDVTAFAVARDVLEGLCIMPNKGCRETPPEKFESSVDTLINELLRQNIKQIGKPVAHMEKKDKLWIIRELRENGVFLIKGSAKKVSKELNVSLATIYKYLEEI